MIFWWLGCLAGLWVCWGIFVLLQDKFSLDWTGSLLHWAFFTQAKLSACSGAGGSCWGAVAHWLYINSCCGWCWRGTCWVMGCSEIHVQLLGIRSDCWACVAVNSREGGGCVLTGDFRLVVPFCILSLMVLIITYFTQDLSVPKPRSIRVESLTIRKHLIL